MAKTTKTEETKVKKINRRDAANRVVVDVNGKTSLSALATKANQLFVEGGGKDNVRDASWHVKRALETAEALGIVKLVRPTDITVEKVK